MAIDIYNYTSLKLVGGSSRGLHGLPKAYCLGGGVNLPLPFTCLPFTFLLLREPKVKRVNIYTRECCQQNYVIDAMCFLVNTQLLEKTSSEQLLKHVCHHGRCRYR